MAEDPRALRHDDTPPRRDDPRLTREEAEAARARDEAARRRDDDNKPARDGDILGLSDAPSSVKLPTPPGPPGNPAGIEVGPTSGGMGELSRGSGATGMDMGYGGTGTDITPRPSRPKSGEAPEE